MRKIIPLAILVLVALIFQVSASVVCSSTNPVTQSYLEGSIPIDEFTIATSCLNNGENSVTSTVASNNNFFSLLEHPITINSNSTKGSLKIKFNQAITQGLYNGFVVIGDLTIPISLNVTKLLINSGDIIVFPTSKVISVKQGDEKTQNIIISVPTSYPRTITIQSVDFNPGVETIKFGDLNLGLVPPGQSISIPIVFSAKDAQVGTYQTNLRIFASDSEGQINLPQVSLQMQVTAGITPIDQTTFAIRPSCALSASELNFNATYTLTCTNVQNNIQVSPQPNELIEGIRPDISSNIYTYQFRAVKYGSGKFRAIFNYQNSPVFTPFEADIKVTSSGSIAPGTDLRIIYTPSLDVARSGTVIALQVVDNRSGSLVQDPNIEINAIPITNKTERTYFYVFEINKNYSVRATSPGYSDYNSVISLSSKPINLIISPESGSSNTLFNITTDANATIFVNGESKGTNYFGTLPSGNLEIKAFKEGYIDAIKNITINSLVSFTTNPEFKKGKVKIISLDRNSTWNLYYQKSPTDLKELLITGEGNKVEFTPTETGDYILETPDGSSSIYSIQGTNWNKKWWFMAWYWWILIIVGIIGFILYRNGNSNSTSGVIPYAGGINNG